MGFQSPLVPIFSLQIHKSVFACCLFLLPQDTMSFKLNAGLFKYTTVLIRNFDFIFEKKIYQEMVVQIQRCV